MDTTEIIKKAISLPFKAYKGFILVIFLFFISEIIREVIYRINIEYLTPLLVLSELTITVFILGICIALVYHYIDDSFDIKEVSLKTVTKAGFKDRFIEIYYYLLLIIGTIIISSSLGIYKNIFSVMDSIQYVDAELESMTLPKLLNLLSPESYTQLTLSIAAILIIFITLFSIVFAYCSFAKIRLKETGNMEDALNFVKLSRIIKNKGLKKFVIFVILTLIVFGTVLVLIRTLEPYPFIGNITSAFTEAYALFFVLHSYSLFYYSDNIN